MRLSVKRPSSVLSGILICLLVVVGCDAEADLQAYFGTPMPSPGAPAETHRPTVSPDPSPTPSPPPSPTATPPPTAAPSPDPSPTASPGVGPTLSPSPTRPPNLAPMPELRQRATEVPLDRLAANPDRFVGELLFFEGRVLGVRESGDGRFRARVRAGSGVIHLTYEAATYWGQPLVPQDRIRVVGYFRGLSDAPDDGRVPVIEVYDLLVRFT